jgi:hypothetical protein
MQVSATLIAAQQAAREAQARFHATHVSPPPAQSKTQFSAALEKTDGFSALPLKQTAAAPQSAAQPAAAQPQQGGVRLGQHIDIRI